MLKDFKGFLQTDGYAGYDQFYQHDGIQMLHCMAHARRYFKEAENNDNQRSNYALNISRKFMRLESIKEQTEASDANSEGTILEVNNLLLEDGICAVHEVANRQRLGSP